MPTQWTSFPIECKGGLITNLAPLQLGVTNPGAARKLVNFEPSTRGGYRRIQGYAKYDEAFIPPYGEPVVQGGSQTGTSLNIANIYVKPLDGDTFTIDGVTGTYTISSSTYSSANKTAALTISPPLNSSPTDKADITFNNNATEIDGIRYWNQRAYAFRNTDLWVSKVGTTNSLWGTGTWGSFNWGGGGWTRVSKPSYGTVLVEGGSQTGGTLDVDGLDATPQVGDTFTIDSVALVYTITAAVTVTSGAATLTITPNLDSSPADNAAITFLSTDVATAEKVRFDTNSFTGTPVLVGVNGHTAPFRYDGTTFTRLNDAPSDAVGAKYVAEFADCIFYADGNILSYTAPFTDNDFSTANGSGSITIHEQITGLFPFREELIIFSSSTIHRLVGSSFADFQLLQITEDLGCLFNDTIQEVGGDIMFLSQGGLRFLSATERNNDFGLALASRSIQPDMITFRSGWEDYCSAVIRGKNQYRIFGYTEATSSATTRGYIATQFTDQEAPTSWSEIMGIKARVADSRYCPVCAEEFVLFANNDGFVYRMEQGSSFDGGAITAQFYTPWLTMDDPRIRKTVYKLNTYFDPDGVIEGNVRMKLDYNSSKKIQPRAINFTNDTSDTAVWGSGTWGEFNWGGSVTYIYRETTVGSGFSISFEYEFEDTNEPFSVDTLIPEYKLQDRQ